MSAQGAVAMPAVRAIPFDLRHLVRALGLSAIAYAFFLVWALLLTRIGVADHVVLMVVHVGSALALWTCWRFGRWGRARFDGFGAALLLFGLAFRLLALVDTLAYGTRVDDLYRYRALPMPEPVMEIVIKGETITLLGMLLVACVWRYTIGRKVEHFSALGSAGQVPPRLPMLVYAAALIAQVVDRVMDASFGPFQQILSLLSTFGVAAIYFIAIRKDSAPRQVVTAGILGLPLSLLVLNSGMKEMMLFPFIPAAILYWIRFNHVAARAAAVFLAIGVLSVSQLYVHHVRATTWRAAGNVDMSTGELMRSFGSGVSESSAVDGLDAISSRVNQTTAHTVTVTLADNRGHEPMAIFGAIPASVVPRVFWPGKPILQPGAQHTARMLGGEIPVSQIASATAAGFFTELYLGGWWFGMILGSIAYGVLLAVTQKWALGYAPGFGHQAYCFLVLYSTIRFDETHVVYAYTAILFSAVFIWMLTKAGLFLGLGTTPVAMPALAKRW